MKKSNKPTIIEEISPVREILELQIARIQEISRSRLLVYEEVKVLDILNKNLLLEMGKSTNSISVESRRLEEINALPNDTLMQLAQAVDADLVARSLEVVNDDSKTDK